MAWNTSKSEILFLLKAFEKGKTKATGRCGALSVFSAGYGKMSAAAVATA